MLIKPTVWIAAVTILFSASRGLSLAVTLCSTGIASSFVPLLTVFLLEDFGWRTTYLLLGGMAAVAGIPILFMFFSSAKDKARRPTAPSVGPRGPAAANIPARKRSEEHTSELQSLMRISYAVFCLKNKKTK